MAEELAAGTNISPAVTTTGSLSNSATPNPSASLTPTMNMANTVANPVTNTVNGIPYADQNPGQDTYRMYDPTGWVHRGNTTGKLGDYQGPVPHQYVPFGQGGSLDPSQGFNQVMMELSQHFEPLIQMSVLTHPRWWHDRIPRGSFTLFNGAVHETRIFRGGLVKYSGLDEWQDIDPYPTKDNNPCGALPYQTFKYGWEALSWRGKKSAWGSDPICVDQFKFMDQAQQQLAWILQTGAEYGIQMQEVWNRDMFIYQSVAFNRSFVMSSEYTGPGSDKYVYDPFNYKSGLVADSTVARAVTTGGVVHPYVVFKVSSKIENLNFDALDLVREELKASCPTAAVSSSGGNATFAIAVSAEDVERYIRGNERERELWVEANPQALITGYGFAPTTFRKWIITNDGNQLRFKIKAVVTLTEGDISGTGGTYFQGGMSEALDKAGFEDGDEVFVAVAVDPQVASTRRRGINGTIIPEYNPEYYTAEIAIAPIFMNNVFTNQFVPSVSSLGSGTSFGPVTGLNGNWGWLNIQTPENPFRNRGNFYGQFEIVPKPETHVVFATSFLYKRCVGNLPSLCPAENPHVNRTGMSETTTAIKATLDADASVVTLTLNDPLLVSVGDEVDFKIGVTDITSYVVSAVAPCKIEVQISDDQVAEEARDIPAGTTVTAPDAMKGERQINI